MVRGYRPKLVKNVETPLSLFTSYMATLTFAAARAYQQSFQSHPHVTLAVTGGTLNAVGDLVAQATQRATQSRTHEDIIPYDPVRTLRFFCFGFGISPMLGRWNLFLEHRFPLRSLTGSKKVSFSALGKRVACDQLVMAPIGLTVFLASMGIMEGRSPSQIKQKFSDLYKTAIITNWKVWPLAQFVNFRFMPLPYRIPFQSTCGVFWTLYLSLINSNEDTKQDRQIEMRKTLDGSRKL
jgi:protein Mpv17